LFFRNKRRRERGKKKGFYEERGEKAEYVRGGGYRLREIS